MKIGMYGGIKVWVVFSFVFDLVVFLIKKVSFSFYVFFLSYVFIFVFMFYMCFDKKDNIDYGYGVEL